MERVVIFFYKIMRYIKIISLCLIVFCLYSAIHDKPIQVLSILFYVYVYFIFIKKLHLFKKFKAGLRLLKKKFGKDFFIFYKNRIKRKYEKHLKKKVGVVISLIKKAFIIFKNFLNSIQDTRKIDLFLRRYHLRFLMRVV